MGKRLQVRCAVVAAAALASSGASAQGSNVTLAGVVDVALRSVHNSKGTLQSEVSGSNSTSRMIIRGVEDLGGGMTASFWLEGTFFADTGTFGAQFWDRQSTVRLSGPFGEIRLGRDWLPSFLSYAATDVMGYVGVGAMGNLISVGGTTAISRAFGSVTPTTSRSNNAVEYWLPGNLGGLYGNVLVAAGENANAQGSFRLTSGRVGYRGQGLDVSGHWTGTRIDATGSRWTQSGLTGLYTTSGGVRINAAWVDINYQSSKQRGLFFGVAVPIGVHEIRASVGLADQKGTNAANASIDANDARQYAVSYVYNLSKRSAVYANAARVQNKGAATYSISGGAAGATPGTSHTGVEFGVRHAF